MNMFLTFNVEAGKGALAYLLFILSVLSSEFFPQGF